MRFRLALAGLFAILLLAAILPHAARAQDTPTPTPNVVIESTLPISGETFVLERDITFGQMGIAGLLIVLIAMTVLNILISLVYHNPTMREKRES